MIEYWIEVGDRKDGVAVGMTGVTDGGGWVSRRFVAAGVDCGLVRAQMQITGDANWTSRR